MKDMTVAALAKLTASDSPAPGGGSIAALAGAFAVALATMVARLTVTKKGYENVQEEMRELIEKADAARETLLEQIQLDAAAFDGVMAAMAMPRETDADKAVRREAIQKATWYAAEVPYRTAECSAEILPLAELMVRKGNPGAVTDGLVAAMLARTAVLGALLNVRINLDSVSDLTRAADLREKCAKLEAEAHEREAAIFALTPALFGKGE